MTENPHTIVFDRDQIRIAVERLSGEITDWLEGFKTKSLNLVLVLEGARPFARDLLERMKVRIPGLEVKIHEVRIQGTVGTTLLVERHKQSEFPSREDLLPGPLLIVDDLVDSGLTLKMLRKELDPITSGPVKTAVLVRKFGPLSGPVDFRGFDLNLDLKVLAEKGLKDYWLFGYGMDLDGRQRDLEDIGWVEVRQDKK